MLTKATIHDIEETITGDISCPTKYWNSRITREIKDVERQAGRKVFSELDPEGDLFAFWDTSKHGKEGFVVSLADKLAVVYKVQQETLLFSNQSMKNHVKGLESVLRELSDSCNENNIIDNDQIIYGIIGEALEICQTVI